MLISNNEFYSQDQEEDIFKKLKKKTYENQENFEQRLANIETKIDELIHFLQTKKK